MEKSDAIRAFAETRARATPEPDRRGVAKGDPIGFGPQKVKAAVFAALDARTETEIAPDVGISEALFRKWTREPGFRGLTRQELSEWPDFWIEWARTTEPPVAPLALGPAAEIALRRGVERFLPKAEVEWLIRASRHLEALVKAKADAGPLPKWVTRRYPNGEESIMYALGEKRSGEVGPLEETIKLLRSELFRRAEAMLDRELDQGQRLRLKEILRELQHDER